MKNLITAIALSLATATTATANTCNVNPNAIIDYPGYHGTQKAWYDKGEYLLMFSAVSHHANPISYKHYSNVESIVTHYRLYKEDCRMTKIEVVLTENKERFEAPKVTYTTVVTQLAERIRVIKSGVLKVNRRFFEITTTTGSDGSVKVVTETIGLSLATKFWQNGKRKDWAQDLSGNAAGTTGVDTTHTWQPVLDGNLNNLVISDWTEYTPRLNQVQPDSWK